MHRKTPRRSSLHSTLGLSTKASRAQKTCSASPPRAAGLSDYIVFSRLRNGWTLEKALNTPVRTVRTRTDKRSSGSRFDARGVDSSPHLGLGTHQLPRQEGLDDAHAAATLLA